MPFLPDAADFGLEGSVEAVMVYFLMLHEGVLGNELPEPVG